MWITVLFQNDTCFISIGHTLVKIIEDRRNCIAELILPIERAALRSRGTICVHPVHAVLTDETDQGLRELFYRLIKRFRGRMSVFAEDVVLGLHYSGERSHQHTTFPCKIGIDLILKCGRE